MNSFYTIAEKIFAGLIGTTAIFTSVTNTHADFDKTVVSNTHINKQVVSNNLGIDFVTRMHSLRQHPVTLRLANKDLKITLADSDELRVKGLSDSLSIADDEAMFFSFEKPDKYSFWMKDMNYSIDMIWVDIHGKVIYIVSDAKPESFPKIFRPSEDAIAVIEVKSGLANRIGLKVGQYIGFGN